MNIEGDNLWWKRAVIYELYVDKFAGNFKGLAEKIPYLADLGVNCVHILPHYPSPMIDDGYDVSDYCAVREDLGTLGDFDFFVKEAGNAGIRVMVDLVLNHTSIRHPWFLKAVSDVQSSERGYYFWSKTAQELKDAINCFPSLKPRNWIYNKEVGLYYFSTFYPEQADLNWDNPLIFNEIFRVMDFWALHGVSAFRFDAISHIAKKEGTNSKSIPETHAIIKKIRKYTDEHYPNIAILGEVHDTPEKTQKYFGEGEGDECHLLYHFPLAEAFAEKLILGESESLGSFINKINDIPRAASWLAFLCNHDELSLSTMPEETKKKVLGALDPGQRLKFANGVSVRLKDICMADGTGDSSRCMRTAFQLLFSVSSAHMLYYGEELGMANIQISPSEKDTRFAVRGAFDWEEAGRQAQDPDSLLNYVKSLISQSNSRKL